jgi:hypothetical protein
MPNYGFEENTSLDSIPRGDFVIFDGDEGQTSGISLGGRLVVATGYFELRFFKPKISNSTSLLLLGSENPR